MAQAGARGAAETTKLVFESVTGLNLSSGSEGECFTQVWCTAA